MMPTLLGGVVLSYIAIDNMLEGPLRIFLKDYIDLKEFGSNIREEGLFYLVLGLGIFQIIIALQSFIQPVIEINNGRIAIRTKENRKHGRNEQNKLCFVIPYPRKKVVIPCVNLS